MAKTQKFLNAVRIIFKNEGGYVDNPNDSGGKTNMGITEGTLRTANKYGITKVTDVRNLTRDICENIYYEMYWKTCGAEDLMEPIDLMHFDASVHHGVAGANKILQKAINNVLDSNVLVVDGIVGKNTKNYIDKVITDTNSAKNFSLIYLDERDKTFQSIVNRAPKNKVFLKGWLNRTKELRRIVKSF